MRGIDRHEEEAQLAQLRKENDRLKKLLNVYSGGPRTRNTDMIMGALHSGGDVPGLAQELARREEGS